MRGHRSSGATKRAPARNPFGAGGFCVLGSSKGSLVVPATSFALLLPTPQNPLGAGTSTSEKRALVRDRLRALRCRGNRFKKAVERRHVIVGDLAQHPERHDGAHRAAIWSLAAPEHRRESP